MNPRGRLRSTVLRLWDSPTLTTWIQLGVQSFSLLVVVPFVILKFDSVQAASYLIFSSLLTFTLIVPRRLSLVFSRIYTFAYAGSQTVALSSPDNIGTGPNWALIRDTYSTTRKIFVLGAGAIALVCAIIGAFGIYNLLHYDDYPRPGYIWSAFTVLIAGTFIRLFLLRNIAFLRGMNRIAQTNRWDVLFNAVAIAATALAIVLGAELVTCIVIQQAGYIATGLRNRYIIHRDYRDSLQDSLGGTYEKEILQAALPVVGKGLIVQYATVGVLQFSSVIYTTLFSPETVTALLFAIRLVTNIGIIAQAPFSSAQPLFSRLWAMDDLTSLDYQFRRRLILIQALLTAGLLAVIAVFAFSGLSARIEIPTIGLETLIVLSALYIFDRHSFLIVSILEAANRVVMIKEQIFAGILTLVVIYPLGKSFGPLGVVIAIWGARLIVFNLRPTLLYKKTNLGSILQISLIPLVAPIAILAFFSLTILVFSKDF